MKSKILNFDMVIKNTNLSPQNLPKIDKIVFQINHSPAIKNKNSLYPAIASNIFLTNQYPQIRTAKESYSSFNIRKGMQYSLLTTIRHEELISNFLLKFMFFIYPQYFIAIDTSLPSNVFPSPSSDHNYHLGIKIGNQVSANIAIIVKTIHNNTSLEKAQNKELQEIVNKFFFSYWNLPI